MGEKELTEDSLKYPEIGDIWKIGDHFHYLVMEEKFNYWNEREYVMYIIERDMYDCLSMELIQWWNGVKVA